MNNQLEEFIGKSNKNQPATGADIKVIETYLGDKLPTSYLNLLLLTDGFSGEVANGSFLQIWKSGEVANRNDAYKAKEFIPGMLIIGSDGGEEAVGIDMRKESDTFGHYFMVPFEILGWADTKHLGSNIEDIKII